MPGCSAKRRQRDRQEHYPAVAYSVNSLRVAYALTPHSGNGVGLGEWSDKKYTVPSLFAEPGQGAFVN